MVTLPTVTTLALLVAGLLTIHGLTRWAKS